MYVHPGERQLKWSVTFDSHNLTKQGPGYAHIYCHLQQEKEELGNTNGEEAVCEMEQRTVSKLGEKKYGDP